MAELKPVTSLRNAKDEIELVFGDLLSSSNAQSHAVNNSGELNQQHICDICGSCFPCRIYLNRHVKNVHVEVNVEHQQCPKCPMKFKKYDTFWEHVIRVHENPSSTAEEGETEEVSSAEIINKNAEVQELVALEDEKEIEALVESMVSEDDDNVCKQCGKRLCGKTNVKRHIREVHLKLPPGKTHRKRVACEKCGKTFVNNSVYNSHMRNIHFQLEPTFECSKCSRKFKELKGLRRHLRDVHRVKTDTSSINPLPSAAPSTSYVETSAVENVLATADDPDQIFSCSMCSIQFVSLNGLSKHYKNIHRITVTVPQPEENFQCSECGKKFSSKNALSGHVLVHQLTASVKTDVNINPPPPPSSSSAASDDPIFSCSKCEIQFVSVDGLNRHNKSIHGITTPTTTTVTQPPPEETFQCTECGKKFSSKNALSGHAIVHQKASLEPHIKTMLKAVFGVICNSKLTCKICGTDVSNSIEGRLHVYIKHPEKFKEFVTEGATSAQGLSQCTYCEEKVAGLESMISHVESSHPDKYIPTCSQCGHKELKERYINLHYKQFHPEVSRYNCDVCKRQFNQRRDLQHHMKSEHSVHSVQCPYCEEKHVKVKLHVTVKHPEKAEEYTQIKKAAIREEQVARQRFNQFLEKGIIPTERNSKAKPQQRRKKVSFSAQSEQEAEDEQEMNEDMEYDEDDEIVDVKPNVCFVKETPKVVIPELYALQKDSTTPHRIEVHRLPPPPPPTVAEKEIDETDGKHNQLEDNEDVKPDVDQLKVCVIINPTVDSSNSPEQPVKKTATLCLERLTDDQIAQWTIPSSQSPPSSTTTDLTMKSHLSRNVTNNTSRRGRKRRRR